MTLALAGWAILALIALALVPAAWVLAREALRRWVTNRAVARLNEVRRMLGDAPGADVDALLAEISARFDEPTIERAVVALMREPRQETREWGAHLFVALGLVAKVSARVREATKWTERAYAAEVLGLAASPDAVPALVAALRDRDEDESSVKVAAAEALAKIRDPGAIPLLTKELLEDGDRSSRSVAEVLVAFGALAVAPVLELLGDPSHREARVWAARILGRIGDARATDDLTARLHDRDDLLRMAAAEALGAIGDRRALQALVRATLRDPAPQVRAHAAGAVAHIEGDRAIDVLVAALADPDYGTRLRALEAFETMRIADTAPLEAGLRDPNAEVRRRAALALERLGYLEQKFQLVTSDDAAVRDAAYEMIVELARVGLLDSVASYVHNTSFEVRAVAARICGEIRDARVAPLLLHALDDEAWPVRASVCEALGRLKHDDAPEALLRRLEDVEETVREAAAEALTSYAPEQLEKHRPALATAYDKGSVPIRTHAITLAGRIAGDASEDLLVRACTDPSDAVRLRAVAALGDRTSDKRVEPLVLRLTDASLDVRLAAIAALGSAASNEAFEGLLRALGGALPAVRDRIAEALSRGARDQLFARLEELERGSLDVRIGIAWTLGKTGDPAAVAPLARFLRDGSARLRASAAGALAKTATPEALDALLGAIEDPDGHVRAAVVNALARVGAGAERATLAMERRARDPDAFVRNRALVGLARMGGGAVEARVLALVEGANPAARLVALALVGTMRAIDLALDALVEERALDRVEAFLEREDVAVRSAFYTALHLDDPRAGAPEGDPASVIEQYEHVLRTKLDVGARTLAVRALARLGIERTMGLIADVLVADPSEVVRLHAARALAPAASDARGRKALARAVADPSAEIALVAVRALAGRKEPEVRDALLKRLGAGTPEVQEAVEAQLADLFRDDPMTLADWMMGTDQPELLAASVRVLGMTGSVEAVPLLAELARSLSWRVRAAALRALGATPSLEAATLVGELMQDPNEEVRLAALDALPMPEGMLRAAPLRRDPSVRVRAAAAASLARVEGASAKHAVDALEKMLEDPSPIVRASALASLVASPDADAGRVFLRGWSRARVEERAAMRQEPRARAISDMLVLRLGTSPRAIDRRAALVALGAFGVDGFEAHVVPLLRDPAPEVRIDAVHALAHVEDAKIRKRIAEMISDPDPSVREEVRRALHATVT